MFILKNIRKHCVLNSNRNLGYTFEISILKKGNVFIPFVDKIKRNNIEYSSTIFRNKVKQTKSYKNIENDDLELLSEIFKCAPELYSINDSIVKIIENLINNLNAYSFNDEKINLSFTYDLDTKKFDYSTDKFIEIVKIHNSHIYIAENVYEKNFINKCHKIFNDVDNYFTYNLICSKILSDINNNVLTI